MNGRQVRRSVGWGLAWVMVLGLWLAPLMVGAAPFGEGRSGPGGEGPLEVWSPATAGRAIGSANRAPEGPATPDEVVLWNQPLHPYDWSMAVNQEFLDASTYSSYVADDFVNGDPWSIRAIFVPGDGWNGFSTLSAPLRSTGWSTPTRGECRLVIRRASALRRCGP